MKQNGDVKIEYSERRINRDRGIREFAWFITGSCIGYAVGFVSGSALGWIILGELLVIGLAIGISGVVMAKCVLVISDWWWKRKVKQIEEQWMKEAGKIEQ